MSKVLLGVMCACLPLFAAAADSIPGTPAPKVDQPEAYQPWKAVAYAIQEPLGGLKGNAANGRKIAIDRSKGNCLACHVMPIQEEEFHGELGPALGKIGKKYNEGKLRMRIVNIQEVLADSLMPPFYMKPDKLNRVVEKYQGRTVLTAQEVEDVVAYLTTLK